MKLQTWITSNLNCEIGAAITVRAGDRKILPLPYNGYAKPGFIYSAKDGTQFTIVGGRTIPDFSQKEATVTLDADEDKASYSLPFFCKDTVEICCTAGEVEIGFSPLFSNETVPVPANTPWTIMVGPISVDTNVTVSATSYLLTCSFPLVIAASENDDSGSVFTQFAYLGFAGNGEKSPQEASLWWIESRGGFVAEHSIGSVQPHYSPLGGMFVTVSDLTIKQPTTPSDMRISLALLQQGSGY